MELKYDKEIKNIQEVINRLNEAIVSIQNDELGIGEIGKQKIPIVLNKRINAKLIKKQELQELQKPIDVGLIL